MISTEIADDPLELEMGFLANDPARCLVINGFHQIFGDRTQTRLREGNRSTRKTLLDLESSFRPRNLIRESTRRWFLKSRCFISFGNFAFLLEFLQAVCTVLRWFVDPFPDQCLVFSSCLGRYFSLLPRIGQLRRWVLNKIIEWKRSKVQ